MARSDAREKLGYAVVSHVFTTGTAHELVKFLKRASKSVVLVSHPFYVSSGTASTAQVSHDSGRESLLVLKRRTGFDLLDYSLDFLSTVTFFLKSRLSVDVFIGLDNLNALAGAFLQRLGLAGITVFYAIDFVERRFPSRLLNWLYRTLENLAVHQCNLTWNLSARMIEGRRKVGINMDTASLQAVVPTGANFEEIQRLPFDQIEQKSLAYLGTLRTGQGLELLVGAMPAILQRVPESRLIIIGSGPLEEILARKVAMLGLTGKVLFKGFVADHSEVERMLSRCALGIALYEPTPGNFTHYADPGKVKVYAACGLPIVTTKVPEIAAEIEESGAGVIVDYAEEDAANQIAEILSHRTEYLEMREAAIRLAEKYAWSGIFARALATLPPRDITPGQGRGEQSMFSGVP